MDAVILYVDSRDPEWQKLYKETFPQEEIFKVRYEPDGSLKYLFRCIDKNLPFLKTIHFIVQGKSQVPEWLDPEKVHIVLHEDFIPKEFLPTYNSRCIESFIHKIPGLDEQYLIINDDCYPIDLCNPSDFFNEGLPIYSISLHENNSSHRNTCMRTISLLYNFLKKEPYSSTKVPLPQHGILPLCKTVATEAYELMKENIHIHNTSKKRKSKDGYCYLPIYYAWIENKLDLKSLKSFKFIYQLTKENFNEVQTIINNKLRKTICINEVKDGLENELKSMWERFYPALSKFEKN